MSTYAHFSDLTASDPLHVSLKADSFTNKDLKTKLLKDVEVPPFYDHIAEVQDVILH